MKTTKHRKVLQWWGIAITAIATVACSPRQIPSQQIQSTGPISQEQTGLIVSGASEGQVAQLLAAHPNGKVRYISANHQTFEILNLDASTVTTELPQAEVNRNRFFVPEFLQESKQENPSPLQIMATLSANVDGIPDVENCSANNEAPNIIVESFANAANVNDGTMDISEFVSMTARKSSAHPGHPSDLKMAWLVVPPEDSNQSQALFAGPNIKFQPDNFGLYVFALVVQDDRNVCDQFSLSVMVSGNDPFVKSDQATIDNLNWSLFDHLSLINAEKSWEISRGEETIIAVIDSGVNYNHEALNSNILINADEIAGDGIDNDGNGFVDDVIGYDFVNSDNLPFDDQGHGSHVAGLAASPYFGTAKGAKIMGIKAFSPMGGDIATIVGAIYYAVDNGAHIINMSFGHYEDEVDPNLAKAIDYAEQNNVLIVAAAGNGHPKYGIGMSTDHMANFPSALPNENILAVASTDSKDFLAFYSNFGKTTVDLGAPGGGGGEDLIYSAYYKNVKGLKYKGMVGTSMATPIVAGVAAQVRAANRNLSAVEIKEILMDSGDVVEALAPSIVSGKRLNAFSAVKAAKAADPFSIFDML